MNTIFSEKEYQSYLLERLNEDNGFEIRDAINDFIVNDENDQAFLEGVMACRRIVKFMEEVKA